MSSQSRLIQRGRVACSGRARDVLDYIDHREREERWRHIPRKTRTVTLPTVPDPSLWPLLQVSTPMTQIEWDAMLRMIDVVKIGLVEP